MTQLESAANIVLAISSKDFDVRAQQCVKIRNRNATCNACIDACPTHAIKCNDNILDIDWSRCTGCGACIAACPVEVFRSTQQNSSQLVEAALNVSEASEGVVTIMCQVLYARAQELVDPDKILVVPCLGRIDESILVRIAQGGASSIVLAHGECSSCDSNTSGAQAQTVVHNTKELLSAWGSPCKTQLRGKLPSVVRRQQQSEFDESKRAFFKNMSNESKQVAAIIANATLSDILPDNATDEKESYHVLDDGTLPKADTVRRAQLLLTLDALAQKYHPEPETTLHLRLFNRVAIDRETCRTCCMCANFCPVGALRKFKIDSEKLGVTHMPALCVGCGCCQDICPAKALKLYPLAKVQDVTERKTYAYYMNKPFVEFNRPDTMFRKVSRLINSDQLYDLQR